MAPPEKHSEPGVFERVFPGTLGLILGLALLKFGNPVILEAKIQSPATLGEAWYGAWPLSWSLWLLLVFGCLVVFPCWKMGRRTAPKFSKSTWTVVLAPGLWLAWQAIAAMQTVDAGLTWPTFLHFLGCVGTFYFGYWGLARAHWSELRWFFRGVMGAFGIVLAYGIWQHIDGFEETRRFFYSLPNWRDYPASFIQKLQSNRIYSTLFYPNALAGVILLLLPAWVIAAGWWAQTWGKTARRLMVVGTATIGLMTLYWTGSKGGWLIGLWMGLIVLMLTPLPRRQRLLLVLAVASLGSAGFLWRHFGYLARGATSVSARIDYWKVAGKLTFERPILGSGPGTFFRGYQRLKTPTAEMTRVVHNDYLQQASDSGVLGAALWMIWILGAILGGAPRRSLTFDFAGMRYAVWLGVVGLAIQEFVEFGFYIPAVSWLWLTLSGWLFGLKQLDKCQNRG